MYTNTYIIGKTKEAAEARDAAAKEKKKCEAAVKASADKDVRIKELEAQLKTARSHTTELRAELQQAADNLSAQKAEARSAAAETSKLKHRLEHPQVRRQSS